jgi:hypothetical protein
MRVQFASMIIDLAYNQEKSIIIRRFPTEFETKELKKSKYQLVDEEVHTSDNQLQINMYYNPRRKFVTVISGGNFDFKEGGECGVDIDIKIKHAEQELNKYICEIIRRLCKTHFKPCILYPSRHSVDCQIDSCTLNQDKVKMFLEDFVVTLESTIGIFKVMKKEKKIEEKAEEEVRKYETQLGISKETCFDCRNEIESSKMEQWFDEDSAKTVRICRNCWNKRKENKINDKKKEKLRKKDKKVRTIIIILIIIAITLVAGAVLGLL